MAGTRTRVVAAILAVGAAVVLARDGAVADDAVPARTTPAGWVFDLRVVGVVVPRDVSEKGPPFDEVPAGGPLVATPWPVLLQTLKARGSTRLLLDRRVTALPGAGRVEIDDSQTRGVEMLNRRDASNETWVSGVIDTGVKAALTTGDAFGYVIEVRWATDAKAPNAPPLLQGRTGWQGAWPAFDGRTLVLSHRQQIDAPGLDPTGLEIYVFLTATAVR
jgi:hypothetical protein